MPDIFRETFDTMDMPRYVKGVIVLAMEAGCRDPDEGLEWARQQGYIVDTGEPVGDPEEFRVTEAARVAVDARFPVEAPA